MSDATSHLPLWALYGQAFGTIAAVIIAAAIASVIQYRQWQVARDKLRLDLFEKRYKIYAAVYDRKTDLLLTTKEHQETLKRIQNDLRGYLVLFGHSTVAGIGKIESKMLQIRMRLDVMKTDTDKQVIMDDIVELRKLRDELLPSIVKYIKFE